MSDMEINSSRIDRLSVRLDKSNENINNLTHAVTENTAEMKELCRRIDGMHSTLYGNDGMSGLVHIGRFSKEKAEEHETLLRGKNKNNGLVHEVQMFKRVATYLGGGGIIGAFLEFFKK
jgi:hypothetical protein